MNLRTKLTYWYRVFQNITNKEIWLLEGNELSTGQPLKIIFSGRVQNKFHITKLAFGEQFSETYLGKKKYWHLWSLIRKNKKTAAMAIIEGINSERHLYRATNGFFVPLWLESVVDIPLQISSNSLKEDLRKIKNNQLNYYVTSDLEKIDTFFHHWYLPTVRKQYRHGAFEYTFGVVKSKVKKGNCRLLITTFNGEDIIGALLLFETEIPVVWINGIRDWKYQNLGAFASTYYFASLYVEELGYKKLSFLNSRSFLNDGLLQYKRKWQPGIRLSDTRGYIVKPLNRSNAFKGFMLRNPFTYIKKGKFYGAVFVTNESQSRTDDEIFYKKKYFINGFSGINIFLFEDRKSPKYNKKDHRFRLLRKIV